MNVAHIHLMLNHLPVMGAAIGVLLLAAAFLRRSDELTKASLALLALLGVASVVVYLTGEPAEKIVEKVAGFSESVLERHEDVALLATISMGVLGALSLLTLVVFRRRPLPRWTTAVALVLCVGVAAVMAYTANLGGQIRHTEIRSTAAADAPALGDDH
jgi:uncharacterized membrane protein